MIDKRNTLKEKELCYTCMSLVFDSCCNGYCNNNQRKIKEQKVIDDSGCKITSCLFYKEVNNN